MTATLDSHKFTKIKLEHKNGILSDLNLNLNLFISVYVCINLYVHALLVCWTFCLAHCSCIIILCLLYHDNAIQYHIFSLTRRNTPSPMFSSVEHSHSYLITLHTCMYFWIELSLISCSFFITAVSCFVILKCYLLATRYPIL